MYKLMLNSVNILRNDGAVIPPDPTLGAYSNYLDWLAAGGTVGAADPLPIVAEVQMRQARLALLQAGYYDAVDNAINAMTGASGKAAKIEWQVSNTLRRNHPLVTTMGAMLGLSPSQLDGLFTLAASL